MFETCLDLNNFATFGLSVSDDNLFLAKASSLKVRTLINSPRMPTQQSVPEVFQPFFQGKIL